MLSQMIAKISKATRSPEFNICIFAAMLNLPWEFLQVPFFSGMSDGHHWTNVKICFRATLGDVLITLISYWVVALLFMRRHWLSNPAGGELALFIGLGVIATVVIERLALAGTWVGGWAYSERMYVIPVLKVGLAPLLQWLLLPPLVVWFSRRQIAAHAGAGP